MTTPETVYEGHVRFRDGNRERTVRVTWAYCEPRLPLRTLSCMAALALLRITGIDLLLIDIVARMF